MLQMKELKKQNRSQKKHIKSAIKKLKFNLLEQSCNAFTRPDFVEVKWVYLFLSKTNLSSSWS